MEGFWKPCRATFCLTKRARNGDQSFSEELKKLLNSQANKKDSCLIDHSTVEVSAFSIEGNRKIFANQEKAEIQDIQGDKKGRYQSKDSGKI
jgi:hypothetical protein